MHYPLLRRCLELAERGRGNVSPNPLVGCIIADDAGEILAEAWHQEFGDKHAELLAIECCLRNEKRTTNNEKPLMRATLYVNLEPCCRPGKQPPCTEAMIASGIRRVVFGARDRTNQGAAALRKAGVEVIGPLLEAECRRFNRGFFSVAEQGRPWVTLKKAMTRDGQVKSADGGPRGKPLKITSEEQDAWAHARLRATHDAILVGAGTVIADDPQLNVRFVAETRHGASLHRPRRVTLDPRQEIPKTARMFTDADAARTLLIREKLPIPELLKRLLAEGITSVLVEGGPRVWQSFEESGCIDECIILPARRSLGGGGSGDEG